MEKESKHRFMVSTSSLKEVKKATGQDANLPDVIETVSDEEAQEQAAAVLVMRKADYKGNIVPGTEGVCCLCEEVVLLSNTSPKAKKLLCWTCFTDDETALDKLEQMV